MDEYLPGEVAALVLRYLAQNNCESSVYSVMGDMPILKYHIPPQPPGLPNSKYVQTLCRSSFNAGLSDILQDYGRAKGLAREMVTAERPWGSPVTACDSLVTNLQKLSSALRELKEKLDDFEKKTSELEKENIELKKCQSSSKFSKYSSFEIENNTKVTPPAKIFISVSTNTESPPVIPLVDVSTNTDLLPVPILTETSTNTDLSPVKNLTEVSTSTDDLPPVKNLIDNSTETYTDPVVKTNSVSTCTDIVISPSTPINEASTNTDAVAVKTVRDFSTEMTCDPVVQVTPVSTNTDEIPLLVVPNDDDASSFVPFQMDSNGANNASEGVPPQFSYGSIQEPNRDLSDVNFMFYNTLLSEPQKLATTINIHNVTEAHNPDSKNEQMKKVADSEIDRFMAEFLGEIPLDEISLSMPSLPSSQFPRWEQSTSNDAVKNFSNIFQDPTALTESTFTPPSSLPTSTPAEILQGVDPSLVCHEPLPLTPESSPNVTGTSQRISENMASTSSGTAITSQSQALGIPKKRITPTRAPPSPAPNPVFESVQIVERKTSDGMHYSVHSAAPKQSEWQRLGRRRIAPKIPVPMPLNETEGKSTVSPDSSVNSNAQNASLNTPVKTKPSTVIPNPNCRLLTTPNTRSKTRKTKLLNNLPATSTQVTGPTTTFVTILPKTVTEISGKTPSPTTISSSLTSKVNSPKLITPTPVPIKVPSVPNSIVLAHPGTPSGSKENIPLLNPPSSVNKRKARFSTPVKMTPEKAKSVPFFHLLRNESPMKGKSVAAASPSLNSTVESMNSTNDSSMNLNSSQEGMQMPSPSKGPGPTYQYLILNSDSHRNQTPSQSTTQELTRVVEVTPLLDVEQPEQTPKKVPTSPIKSPLLLGLINSAHAMVNATATAKSTQQTLARKSFSTPRKKQVRRSLYFSTPPSLKSKSALKSSPTREREESPSSRRIQNLHGVSISLPLKRKRSDEDLQENSQNQEQPRSKKRLQWSEDKSSSTYRSSAFPDRKFNIPPKIGEERSCAEGINDLSRLPSGLISSTSKCPTMVFQALPKIPEEPVALAELETAPASPIINVDDDDEYEEGELIDSPIDLSPQKRLSIPQSVVEPVLPPLPPNENGPPLPPEYSPPPLPPLPNSPPPSIRVPSPTIFVSVTTTPPEVPMISDESRRRKSQMEDLFGADSSLDSSLEKEKEIPKRRKSSENLRKSTRKSQKEQKQQQNSSVSLYVKQKQVKESEQKQKSKSPPPALKQKNSRKSKRKSEKQNSSSESSAHEQQKQKRSENVRKSRRKSEKVEEKQNQASNEQQNKQQNQMKTTDNTEKTYTLQILENKEQGAISNKKKDFFACPTPLKPGSPNTRSRSPPPTPTPVYNFTTDNDSNSNSNSRFYPNIIINGTPLKTGPPPTPGKSIFLDRNLNSGSLLVPIVPQTPEQNQIKPTTRAQNAKELSSLKKISPPLAPAKKRFKRVTSPDGKTVEAKTQNQTVQKSIEDNTMGKYAKLFQASTPVENSPKQKQSKEKCVTKIQASTSVENSHKQSNEKYATKFQASTPVESPVENSPKQKQSKEQFVTRSPIIEVPKAAQGNSSGYKIPKCASNSNSNANGVMACDGLKVTETAPKLTYSHSHRKPKADLLAFYVNGTKKQLSMTETGSFDVPPVKSGVLTQQAHAASNISPSETTAKSSAPQGRKLLSNKAELSNLLGRADFNNFLANVVHKSPNTPTLPEVNKLLKDNRYNDSIRF